MWDPGVYLAFADQRGRPFHDLLARIGANDPRRVVDLGCGPGNYTELLTARWPGAAIEALDSSPEMVEKARGRGLPARVGDVNDWRPAPDTDVVVSNAVLQWVPGHAELLCRWARELPGGSWLAVQMPRNFIAASHVEIQRLADSDEWRERLADKVLRQDEVVLTARGYADVLAGAGCAVDAWETTYVHRLTGPDPVLDWVRGSSLRPVRAALDDAAWERFVAELAVRLRVAYPANADGTTWYEFRRVFVVARTGAR